MNKQTSIIIPFFSFVKHVLLNLSNSWFLNHIESGQALDNYTYDNIGNLTGDISEEIEEIKWTVYGKVSEVIRDANSFKSDLTYWYDAMGNRIAKIEKTKTGTTLNPESAWNYTFYARDASGNVMATYTKTGEELNNEVEYSLYGSSRLGVTKQNVDFKVNPYIYPEEEYNDAKVTLSSLVNDVNAIGIVDAGDQIYINGYLYEVAETYLYTNNYTIADLALQEGSVVSFERIVGSKFYELSNHLGNVNVVVSDRRRGVDVDSDSKVDYYLADVVSATDYYPFGMIMPGRTYTSESYRYGFNGMEKDGEQWTGNDGSHLDFGARIYDSRLGRWLAMDPLESKYPFLTPYNGMGNNPIWFIDPDGMRIKFATSVRDNGLVKEYKTILKILKQGSPTFKKMLMSVRFNKEVYKLDVTTEDNGDAYLDKVIYISCDNFDNKNVIVFAHEFGHLWRDMKNLDIKTEDIPFEEDTPEHFIFRSKMRLFEEGEALHIENIIRTELNIEHRESYNGLSDFTSKDIVEKFGKRRVEIKNRVIIDIYKEVSYDYKKDHHYKDLKTRKHSSDEIDINKRGVD